MMGGARDGRLRPMNIQELVRQHRNKWIEVGQWQEPDLADCLDFMATEVAEAIDKRLRMSAGYVRNTSRPVPTAEELGVEVFDAIMMGCIALDLLDLDLEEVAATKLQRMDEKKGVGAG
jgi:NTP pyrophosphatase (non-canonical NTP hydrolase)